MKVKKTGLWEELRKDFMKNEQCPVAATIAVIGGKWKPIILYLISHEINRFGEMHTMICGISRKMLTDQLRELESDGIIERKVFAEIPPRVEYYMTEKGMTLRPIILSMREWGLKYAI
ncbi:MAG TPA: helix-turn-helix domain-containing protein [Puia sp.]|nr:helix-turn-helix domain-containing protein [Puia sp.]